MFDFIYPHDSIQHLRSYSKGTRNILREPHVKDRADYCQYFLVKYNYGSESNVGWILSSNPTGLPVQQKIAGFSPSDSSHSRE